MKVGLRAWDQAQCHRSFESAVSIFALLSSKLTQVIWRGKVRERVARGVGWERSSETVREAKQLDRWGCHTGQLGMARWGRRVEPFIRSC